jgi:hypothetical protein
MGKPLLETNEDFEKVLDSFLTASGGKANCLKSQIYGWTIHGVQLYTISKTLGFPCVDNWASFKYL